LLNPFGRAPILEDDDFVLYETQAILRFLAARNRHFGLVPADAKRMARMDQLIGIGDSYLFPQVVRTLVAERLFAGLWNRAPDEARIRAALPEARTCLLEIDRIATGRLYLADDVLSLADVHLFPFLHYVEMTPEGAEILQATCPGLLSWIARMRQREAVSKLHLVWPHQQGS
jgi:glutathione S-transferase